METVRIYRLDGLSASVKKQLNAAQREAARVWLLCRDLHLHARRHNLPWPTRDDLQKATKGGQFALHSQTIQMICHTFLANVDAAKELKRRNPKMRYPYKDKAFYPLSWPAQTVSRERGRVVLPMGRGHPSVVLRVEIPQEAGACKLVWNAGYELHVAIPVPEVSVDPGAGRATVDLGEIHQAAVTTDTGAALVVSGRGIRSLKRLRNKTNGEIARKRSRCKHGSKRWRRLQYARRKRSARIDRQVRDLRHKGTRKIVTFCVEHRVGTLFIGDPDGVRRRRAGRHHNQRMAQWEYGKDKAYLTYKCQQACIESFTGSERGTSSQCPACGRRKKPKGRIWKCSNPECGFVGHRDVVGSANMHAIAFQRPIAFPHWITYRRAGPVRVHLRNKQPRVVARAGPS